MDLDHGNLRISAIYRPPIETDSNTPITDRNLSDLDDGCSHIFDVYRSIIETDSERQLPIEIYRSGTPIYR